MRDRPAEDDAMDHEFGDYGPPRRLDPRDKAKRRCNWCGKPLNPNSPNWFQCSEACRKAKWESGRPKCREDD